MLEKTIITEQEKAQTAKVNMEQELQTIRENLALPTYMVAHLNNENSTAALAQALVDNTTISPEAIADYVAGFPTTAVRDYIRDALKHNRGALCNLKDSLQQALVDAGIGFFTANSISFFIVRADDYPRLDDDYIANNRNIFIHKTAARTESVQNINVNLAQDAVLTEWEKRNLIFPRCAMLHLHYLGGGNLVNLATELHNCLGVSISDAAYYLLRLHPVTSISEAVANLSEDCAAKEKNHIRCHLLPLMYTGAKAELTAGFIFRTSTVPMSDEEYSAIYSEFKR